MILTKEDKLNYEWATLMLKQLKQLAKAEEAIRDLDSTLNFHNIDDKSNVAFTYFQEKDNEDI